MLKIVVEKQDDIKIIKLIGDLDGSTAEEARKEMMEYVEPGSKLIFDMEQCKYISSAGLRVLMIIAKGLKAEGASGVLANLQSDVEDVMEMTGFSHMFQSFDSNEEAIEYHKGESN